MKRLLKPWGVALLVALCLHLMVFLFYKDMQWSPKPSPALPSLELTLLPAKATLTAPFSADSSIKTISNENTPRPDEPAKLEEKATPKTDKQATTPTKEAKHTSNTEHKVSEAKPAPSSVKNGSQKTVTTKAIKPQTETKKESVKPSNNPLTDARTTDSPLSQPNTAIKLDDIAEAPTSTAEAPTSTSDDTDWKSHGFLDIGDMSAISDKTKVDIKKDPFSPEFRQALMQAKRLQDEYNKGVVEETEYPITEDPDGTRYVNIKGICWKLPEPGSGEKWQVVLSGCAGQKDTFRFELNISTDILRSDIFNDLPFGGNE